MNNKFEGWVPSDFKHLWNENIPEPRHTTVSKTITVTDHFSALDKVHLFGWEQVPMALWTVINQIANEHNLHTPPSPQIHTHTLFW